MKNILLSHDSELYVYSVPDIVADNLNEYCCEFDKWLWTSPHAKEHRIDIAEENGGGLGVCFNAHDFIKYLNSWIFPDNPSLLVETLNYVWDASEAPEKYKHCKWFNF